MQRFSSLFTRDQSSLKWLIGVTAAIANGVILFYPAHSASNATQLNGQTVLPPVSESEKAHYAAEIEKYSKLLQHSHTQQEHLALANVLANAGCRDAAAQQYGIAMSHSVLHTHTSMSSCNIQTSSQNVNESVP